MALRAVIFDYGEVLSGPADPERHRNLVAISGLPEDVFDGSYWRHRLEYDAAILNNHTFWQTVARDGGVEFSPQQIERLIEQDARMWMNVNDAMLAWVGELKAAGFRLGILSNMVDGVLREMRKDFAWLAQFQQLTWSCELGIVKPNPGIYLHTIQALEVKPQEALFIDNLAVNITGAEALDLNAILFESVEQLASELPRRGFDLPLPRAAESVFSSKTNAQIA